jgi:hypothetical protein
MARPSREFAPAGDLLFGPPKSRQKAPPAKPPLRGPLRCSDDEARPELAPLRSAQTTVRSQLLKRASHAPRRPALLGGLEGAFPKQPTANSHTRKLAGGCISLTPFSTAEERKGLRACAKRTSSTDSVRLFERSVAKRVPHGPQGLSTAGNPKRSVGRCGRGELFAYFLAGQKVGRPPGRKPKVSPKANPGTDLRNDPPAELASALRLMGRPFHTRLVDAA